MYSLTQENEIIHSAQKGSKSACEQLYAAYEGLIRKMSRRYAYTPTGKIIADDAEGILQLAFMETIRDFDHKKGINFAAFLQSRLHGSIYNAFRQACKYQQRTAHPAASTGEDGHDYFDMLESPQPSPERKIIIHEELVFILSQLNKQEKHLLQLLYIQDLPQIKAARLLHLSPQTLNKRNKRLIQHCQQLRT